MRRARSVLRGRYLIVALLVGAIYANTMGHGFVWDDPHLIIRNVNTHRLRSIPLHFASEFLGGGRRGGTGPVNAYWRPVVLVTLSLDHALWGLAPVGYHLTNVWLHALNAALVQNGTSLKDVQRQYTEKMVAGEWLRQRIPKLKVVTHEEMLAYYQDHLIEYEYPGSIKWEELMVRFDRCGGDQDRAACGHL